MSTITTSDRTGSGPRELDRVVVRFAGDSGDGMQLVGDRFTELSALFGNDLATLPNYPAEIRAPAGTVAGVSSFQVHISDTDIVTPGDSPNVLVAMNPAALKANVDELAPGSTIIVNSDAFDERDLAKAGYLENPLVDGSLERFTVHQVPMTSITLQATEGLGVKRRDAERSKNFFALGLICWMYTRPLQPLIDWVERKYESRPQVRDANLAALRAGRNFGETAELFDHPYSVAPAPLPPGTYANVNGNTALAWGLIAAAELSGLQLVYASYPITPASDILHELSRHKNFGVRTLQAEDEIAGIGTAIGAAFAGCLAVTGSSGPGIALKSEAISLAFMLELPLVVVNVQRGGPSTGLPTKPEQSDLLFSLYGRHGESPVPVLAIASPSDAFDMAIEAARIAIKYMTPVLLLSDNYIANGSEPWKLPNVDEIPPIPVKFAKHPNGPDGKFLPYMRDFDTFARPWAVPGTPGLEHRVGGLEKEAVTGNVSYDPANHQLMVDSRAWKVANIANDIPEVEVEGDQDADLLVLGWGSTYGPNRAAARRARLEGVKVATAHLRYLNPLPRNLGDVLRRFPKILIPELNTGQLLKHIRSEYLVDAVGLNKVMGEPFKVAEITDKILEMKK
jgi:2-oxoglutarate ferredoxin oxidoreductase subunit alpha